MKFKNPPAATRGRPAGKGKHADIAAQLKARPNRWALVMEGVAAANATFIKQARTTAYAPAGSFESVCRKQPSGKYDIYARYVGGQS